jgi:protein SCO1/2
MEGMIRNRGWLALTLAAHAAGCSDGASHTGHALNEHELSGTVVAVVPAKGEITVAHEAIPDYMPAMTMSLRVEDASAVSTLRSGDSIRARLVVTAEDGWLRAVEKIGHRDRALSLSGDLGAPSPPDHLLEGDSVPNQALVAHDGRPIHLREIAGAVVLTFIYTRCPFPTFCPLIDRQFQAVHERVRADPRLSGQVNLLSITIDPEHDTVPVLAAHAAGLGATDDAWRFARVDEPNDGSFAARFGVMASTSGEPASLVHSLVTVIIAPDGRIAKIHRGNQWTVAELTEALAAIVP